MSNTCADGAASRHDASLPYAHAGVLRRGCNKTGARHGSATEPATGPPRSCLRHLSGLFVGVPILRLARRVRCQGWPWPKLEEDEESTTIITGWRWGRGSEKRYRPAGQDRRWQPRGGRARKRQPPERVRKRAASGRKAGCGPAGARERRRRTKAALFRARLRGKLDARRPATGDARGRRVKSQARA